MIRFEKVVKEFGGPLARLRGERVRALDGVTLHVPPGAAVGLVGPNGAGKSTLIRLLLGYLAPSGGGVQVGGMLPRDYAERRGVAYVPDRVALPHAWTVRGALEAFAALGEVDRPAERIEHVLGALGLSELAGRRLAALSKGNLQRLAIAQALLGERKVMVMDEGTDGLDPEWTARVRDLLAEWRRADPERVLVFASHDLDEVERVADQAVILSQGRVREVVALHGGGGPVGAYRLEVEGTESAKKVADAFPGALPVAGRAHAFRVEAGNPGDLTRRLGTLIQAGAVVRSVVPEGGSLRDRYHRAGGSARGKGGAS
ncbi:MAG TPA: ABC transporter ATP-binding protein [Longimicrobiaceae bacterium]|nr:ABC transporter ATP-binding protein [Longimicrobiaceae bacterium]